MISLMLSTIGLHRIALLAAAFATISASPLTAGCQSGDSANNTTTFLLDGPSCKGVASGSNATAAGSNATAKGALATAVGTYAGPIFAADGSTNIGSLSGFTGGGDYSIGIGAGNSGASAPSAFGDFSVAIGSGDDATFPGASANGLRSIAIGQKSSSANYGTSVGFNTATAFASTAIGTDSQAVGERSTAVGRFAKAKGLMSVAIGEAAVAVSQSVALGTGSVANVANTVSVGTNTARRRIVNVGHGVGNTDAATLGQVKAIARTAAVEVLSNETMAKAAAEIASGDLQRELRQMRGMLERLQQELAELKGQKAAALNQ